MKILFYYDPVVHKGDSLWRSGQLNNDLAMIKQLRSEATSSKLEVKVAIGEQYLKFAIEKGIGREDIIILDSSFILDHLDDSQADVNLLFYRNKLSDLKLEGIGASIAKLTGSYVPDVIISWTPVPFFKSVFSEALILHKEMGVFQRNPFPATFFLDPKGVYNSSLLSEKLKSLGSVPSVPSETLEIFNSLRAAFCGQVEQKTPFEKHCFNLSKRFKTILLLPLQYNGSFSFDGLCSFRSQMELAEYVLKNVPESYGVIITSHIYGNLSVLEKKYLQSKYKNSLFVEAADFYENASDLFLPFVDGVVTVSSTIGLKALLWGKILISLGGDSLGVLNDSTSLDGVEELFHDDYVGIDKNPALAWFTLCYCFPLALTSKPNWASDLLSKLLEEHKKGEIDSAFDDVFGDLVEVSNQMLVASKKSKFPIKNGRKILDRGIDKYSPGQQDALRLALHSYTVMQTKGVFSNDAFDSINSHLSNVFSEGKDQLSSIKPKFNSLVEQGSTDRLRILILYASGRWNASGLYLQDLCRELVEKGVECVILAEGDIPKGGEEDGVIWKRFAFDGYLLEPSLKMELLAFNPDILYVINVRFKPMRAALELHFATGAKISVQSEDDDTLIFERFYKDADSQLLGILDKNPVGSSDIGKFFSLIDWDYTRDLFSGKRQYRDVEPILRALCYHLSVLNTAIWSPLLNRLVESFGKPGLLVPPVIDIRDYDCNPLTDLSRRTTLESLGVDPDAFVIFLGGTIYDFSPEFTTFLECLNLMSKDCSVTLVIAGRSRVNIKEVMETVLSKEVPLISLNSPPDDIYLSMMKAADVIAAPGYPDQFNRLRLSSRLVKAMALGKPIFTYECGFGESLVNLENAVLTKTEDPEEWRELLSKLRDQSLRLKIGKAARQFAEEHFDSRLVADNLIDAFMLHKKPASPGDGGGMLSSVQGQASRSKPFANSPSRFSKLMKMIR